MALIHTCRALNMSTGSKLGMPCSTDYFSEICSKFLSQGSVWLSGRTANLNERRYAHPPNISLESTVPFWPSQISLSESGIDPFRLRNIIS